MKRIFSLLLIFTVGGIGGIFLDRFAIPHLAPTRLGAWIPALRRISERTTIVNKTEIVKVEEGEAVPDLADRVKNALVSIEVMRKGAKYGKAPGFLAQIRGASPTSTKELVTGLALTSDGYILAHMEELPAYGAPALRASQGAIVGISLLQDGERLPLTLAASDTSTHFVLVRVDNKQLTALPFADAAPRLGERLFTLSAHAVGGTVTPTFQAAMLSALTKDLFEVSSTLQSDAIIVDFEGEVAGMRIIDAEGGSQTIPALQLRSIGDKLLGMKSS